MSESLVRIDSLSKSFREGETVRQIFQGLNVAIAPGEFVALLGRSGSGKSTLLNLLSGIDQPDRGTVLIAGQNLTTLSERERTLFRRRNIGFIFQFYNLIPTLTVLENLLLPLELIGTSDSVARQQAQTLLNEVGLADRAAGYPDRLSGGEQQRVAVARALIHRPRLLLADEPTGNLDAETGQQVLNLFTRLAQQYNMTTLMVTHSLEVAGLADRILTIRDGQLFEDTGTELRR
ncbi:MAG: ABC transporter ATP-binding protein [Pelovirga sp.]